jgi:hypothetical protein
MRFRLNWAPAVPLLVLTLLMAACAAPSKPPSVDESLKRPANSPAALELQVCKTDLHNTRLAATESARQADTAAALLEQIAALQQALMAMQLQSAMPSASTPTAPPALNAPAEPTKPVTRKHHGR